MPSVHLPAPPSACASIGSDTAGAFAASPFSYTKRKSTPSFARGIWQTRSVAIRMLSDGPLGLSSATHCEIDRDAQQGSRVEVSGCGWGVFYLETDAGPATKLNFTSIWKLGRKLWCSPATSAAGRVGLAAPAVSRSPGPSDRWASCLGRPRKPNKVARQLAVTRHA